MPRIHRGVKVIKEYVDKRFEQLPKLGNDRKLISPLDKVLWPSFIVTGPNPTIGIDSTKFTFDKLNPEDFYVWNSQVIFWIPHVFWNTVCHVKCPLCGERATSKGRSNSIRRVLAIDKTYYRTGWRYKCVNCKGEYDACELAHARHVHSSPFYR
jgi:DNA-directed RNA polymerase subunit RPC12/RpoP